MRRIVISAIALSACLNIGCEFGGKAKVAVPAMPVAAAAPPPVVEAQTVAHLPSPQPIPPESIPPRPPVEYHPPEAGTEPPPSQPAPAVPRRPSRKPPANASAAAPVETLDAPKPETPRLEDPAPALRSAEDKSITKVEVENTVSEVRKLLSGISARGRSAAATSAITRINSFVRLSEQAVARNDLRQADTLARRALALARDLLRPR
jgi:hypothetical protein